MRFGFSSNEGIDILVSVGFYWLGLMLALIVREFGRAAAAQVVGDRVPAMAGRLRVGKHLFDPIGSFVFPLFAAFTGALSYAWSPPLNYDLARPGPVAKPIVSALGGSGANLVLAILLARGITPTSVEAAGVINAFVLASVTMAIMNLLPVPHLDGGRILAAALPPDRRARFLRLERWSIGIVFLIAVIDRWFTNWPFGWIVGRVFRWVF